MKKKFIRLFSFVSLMIVLLSSILPTVVFAARGTFNVDNISTYIKTTKNNEEWGIAGKKLYDSTKSKWKTAFCVELRKRIIYRGQTWRIY